MVKNTSHADLATDSNHRQMDSNRILKLYVKYYAETNKVFWRTLVVTKRGFVIYINVGKHQYLVVQNRHTYEECNGR